MLERIEQIEAEAGAAIEAAPGTAELEELRVRYLGRKAELTAILRGIADLPEEERGAVGGGAQPRPQGAGGAARGRAPRRSTRRAASSGSSRTGSTSPCRARRRVRPATCT